VKLPNLAIHLCREEKPLNNESDLKPMIAMGVVDSLFSSGAEKIADDSFKIEEKHFSTLTQMIANDIGVQRS
jgi:hypothetical protein